tara:strand:- start:4600 stop:5013 length:414 start_codon:yes stop_codon:yes gene_type:complete
MPNYLGGDIIEITCNHPDLGSLKFATKSNETYTIDPGGFRSNDDANGVTGSGEFIDQVNRVRWSVEGPILADFKSDNERKNYTALAKSSVLGTWTFTHASGVTWRGKGKPVGDLNFDTNNAQMTNKIAGGGELEPLN